MPDTTALRAVMVKLRPGDGLAIKLGVKLPSHRVAYQRVNGVAYALWGAGGYRLRAGSDEVVVMRRRKDAAS